MEGTQKAQAVENVLKFREAQVVHFRRETRKRMEELRDKLHRAVREMDRYTQRFDEGNEAAAEWAVNYVQQLGEVTDLVMAYQNLRNVEGHFDGMKEVLEIQKHVQR